MTTISPTAPQTPVLPAATSNPTSNATLSSDFETFLQMLTAQARYQDPLEPVSSSDYAAQLAQFSMVEQQVFTNDQLTALATALAGTNISSLSSWVGMEARAPAAIYFDGSPVTISPNPAAAADRVDLVVYNDRGEEVARRSLPVSADSYDWDGMDENGAVLPAGTYSFAVESYANDELILSDPGEVYARVVEAQIIGGDTVLMLEGGTFVLADQVTALRQPQA